MGVEQNNFRHMLTGYLSGPPQTQHMFGIFPAALVAHTGLAGEERLKAFPLQIFQTVMVGMYAYRSLREVCRSSQKYSGRGTSVLRVSVGAPDGSDLHDQNDWLIAYFAPYE